MNGIIKKNRKQRRQEEKLLRKAQKQQKKESANHVQAMFSKAMELHQTKSPEEIKKFYDDKLSNAQTPLDELELYGMSAIEFGSFEVGIALLNRALLQVPDSTEVLYYLASTYFKIQELDKSIEHLQKIMIVEPSHFPCHVLLASIHLDKNELQTTIDYCQKALNLKRESDEVLTIIGEAFLRQGKFEEAMSALKQAYIVNPIDTRTLSLLFIALSLSKDELNLEEIYCYDKIVRTYVPGCPEGMDEFSEFHQSVVTLLKSHPHLQKAPDGFATKNGSQTVGDLLTTSKHPLLQIIEHQIHLAVKNHVTGLELSEKHPMVLGAPKEYRIASWAIVLDNEGYQDPHVHLDGWLSGVYYLNVPKEVKEELEKEAGYLKFGNWRKNLAENNSFKTHIIKPEDGMIVTFPSFLWHKTIPFKSNENRVCIAFDIIPV
jgi:uncharacterized protein (TIGR02466 family)